MERSPIPIDLFCLLFLFYFILFFNYFNFYIMHFTSYNTCNIKIKNLNIIIQRRGEGWRQSSRYFMRPSVTDRGDTVEQTMSTFSRSIHTNDFGKSSRPAQCMGPSLFSQAALCLHT